MNRSAAKIAEILKVDLPQVEQWAFDFKDYLSSEANPAKGKVRMFTDDDVLVLCYVSHQWDDDPDREYIKLGLNREEHFATPYVEQLYLHLPLIQEAPDRLNETWRHGILIVGGGRYQYLELARNYRRFAEKMLEMALMEDAITDSAYPVLFAYRHTLELYLKHIGGIVERTHSLKKCVELVEKRHDEKIPYPIREWILELDGLDPGGTAFRYADADSSMDQHYEEWFDFRHFRFAMKLVLDTIDNAILKVARKGALSGKNKK